MSPAPLERRVVEHAAWVREARRLFGDDATKWRFRCVSCGTPQTLADFAEAGVKNPEAVVAFSCIGRFVAGKGCDWTLGGLFQIHKVEVVMPDGRRLPSFEFDEAGAES